MSRRNSIIKEVFSVTSANKLPPLHRKHGLYRSNQSLLSGSELERKVLLEKITQDMKNLPDNQFGLTAEDLAEICNFDHRNSPSLLSRLNTEFGGSEGVAINLRCNVLEGLERETETAINPQKHAKGRINPVSSSQDLVEKVNMAAKDAQLRQELFGKNVIPPPPSESILEMVVGQIKEDIILKVLIIGAAVVIALGTIICPATGWIEGITILVAVVIVLTVTSANDYSKDQKFKKLLLLQSDKKVRVIRGGVKDQISSWDLVVGDLIELSPGDEIAADGLYISGNVVSIDESPLTGETEPVKKSAANPFLFSGCQVNEGTALMIATAVGARSSGGQIQKMLNEAQNVETVLQQKLKVVAVQIGKIGVAAGITTFLGLVIRWAIFWATGSSHSESKCSSTGNSEILARLQELATHFVIGITVVVVAVPEGLPLAVTISLAFSMFKMMKDKCFVRQLEASETMGQATVICTDKTGTLTENKMTAVKLLIGHTEYNGEGSGEANATPFSQNTLAPGISALFAEGACLNSSCFIKYKNDNPSPIFVGSATEGAILILCQKLGHNYETLRNEVQKLPDSVWAFSSDRKRMSTLVVPRAHNPTNENQPYRLYTKGASEVVFNLCTDMVNDQGTNTVPISDQEKEFVLNKITQWAGEGLRTIVLAYKDTYEKLETDFVNPENNLVFLGLIGIKDPLRKEVPPAVAACKQAGLSIKMVTGDNILTACKIAKECGILTDGIAMEGPVFRALSDEKKKSVAMKLQVLARSSPADKHTLVCLLQEMGEVVAVTGDGTNDAPALKAADVGFAMGICGTQIAMNASDIVLMDDNFVSLVQSIRWGRNVLDSVRKFLQFQLAVNAVAIVLTFVGAVTTGESPLSTVQLLWVNLIMDSLGALALASDDPDDDVLTKPPHDRSAHLLSIPMREYIVMQGVYQVTALLTLELGLDKFMPTANVDAYGVSRRTKTVVFSSFVFLQVANIIMSRKLNGELNFFHKFFQNPIFLTVVAIILFVQLIVVIFGEDFIESVPLGWSEWVIVAAVSVGNMVVTTIFKIFVKLVRASIKTPVGQVGPSRRSSKSPLADENKEVS